MNIIKQSKDHTAFHTLSPDTIINLVEDALQVDCTNLLRPLNSYINRVFELEKDDGEGLIVKFYRPGRWDKLAILAEHDFLLELHALEIPVIAPLVQQNGKTLNHNKGGKHDGIDADLVVGGGVRVSR